MVKTPRQHAWPRGGTTCEQEAGRVFPGGGGMQPDRRWLSGQETRVPLGCGPSCSAWAPHLGLSGPVCPMKTVLPILQGLREDEN